MPLLHSTLPLCFESTTHLSHIMSILESDCFRLSSSVPICDPSYSLPCLLLSLLLNSLIFPHTILSNLLFNCLISSHHLPSPPLTVCVSLNIEGDGTGMGTSYMEEWGGGIGPDMGSDNAHTVSTSQCT